MKIVGIGESVYDIIFKNDRPSAAVPGGSTFNALISLGRTAGKDFPEVPIKMVTEVGDDHVGDIITSFMESNGVDCSLVTRNRGTKSHISLAFLDDQNNAHYTFYKDHAHAVLSADKVDSVAFDPGDIVVFGSYFAINPGIRDYVGGLLRSARAAGAVLYYDINFRPSHLDDLDRTMGFIEENCRLADIVRGSGEDFGCLFGSTSPSGIYEKHIAPLCPRFICTCGARPLEVFTPELHLSIEPQQVDTVSTIGAGDSFNAGFVYGLLRLCLSSSSALETEAQWKEILAIAGRFSAEVCASIYNYVGEDFKV